MKNFLIFVLLLGVVVLGFLLYRNRTSGLQSVSSIGGGVPKPGTPRKTKDHKHQDITVQDCPTLAGQTDVCIIPISYLESMSGASDYGIVVHRNWTVVWYGDQGETIDVQQLPGRDCIKHDQDDIPSQTEPNLTGTISPKGRVQVARVTGSPDHDGFCFKTTVTVTLKSGVVTTYDPHMFDGGP